jgi:hypothetical protein
VTKFKFRLQRVLDWQSRQCALAKEEMHNCRAEVDNLSESLLRDQNHRAAEVRSVIYADTPPPLELRLLRPYNIRQLAREAVLEKGITTMQAQAQLEDKQRLLLDLRMRVQLLEKLRAKRLQQHEFAMDRMMERESEEHYVAKWNATSHLS